MITSFVTDKGSTHNHFHKGISLSDYLRLVSRLTIFTSLMSEKQTIPDLKASFYQKHNFLFHTQPTIHRKVVYEIEKKRWKMDPWLDKRNSFVDEKDAHSAVLLTNTLIYWKPFITASHVMHSRTQMHWDQQNRKTPTGPFPISSSSSTRKISFTSSIFLTIDRTESIQRSLNSSHYASNLEFCIGLTQSNLIWLVPA